MIGKKIRDFLPEEDLLAYSRGDPARLQPVRTARQQVQGAHQDPRPRERRWRRSPRRSRRSSRRSATACCTCPRTRSRRIAAYFAPPDYPARPATSAALDAARARRSRLRPLGRATTSAAHRVPGYAIVTISLKPIGGVPGDATADQMDARRRPRRALLARRDPRQPRAEPRPAACRAGRSADRLRRACCGTASRPPMPGSSPTSSPARASTTARSPMPARSRSRSASPSASPTIDRQQRDRRAEDQDLRLHQCLRPSPCRPYRHSRRRQEGRGILPDHARRLRRRDRLDRRDHRHGLLHRRGRRRGRDARRHLSSRTGESAGRAVPRRLSPARPGAVQGGALWRCLRPSRRPLRPVRRGSAHALRILNERFARWRTRDVLDAAHPRDFRGPHRARLELRRRIRPCCCTSSRRSTRRCR